MSKKISWIDVRIPTTNRRGLGLLVEAFTGFMPSLNAVAGALGARLVRGALGIERWDGASPYGVAIANALALCERAGDYPGSVRLRRNRGSGVPPQEIIVGTNETEASSWGDEPADVVMLCPHRSSRRLTLWRSADAREIVLEYDFLERPSERIAQAVLETVRRLIPEDLPDLLQFASGRPYSSSITLRVVEQEAEEVSPQAETRPVRRASFRAAEPQEGGETGQ